MSAVALVLDRAWAAMEDLGREPPPHLVTVGSDLEVRLCDLGFSDPLLSLVGLVAPADAAAVGIATGGWAIPPDRLDGAVDVDRGRLARRPSSHPDAVRVRTLVLVERSGLGLSRLRIAGGPPRDAELPEGFATDVLRRTLRLATPRPAVPVDELLDCTWLAAIVRCSRALGRRLTWAEAVDLRVDDGVSSWDAARLVVAMGVWPELGLSPDAAAWMDDGIFARWCLGRFPPVHELVLEARRHLRASAWRQLRFVVTSPS